MEDADGLTKHKTSTPSHTPSLPPLHSPQPSPSLSPVTTAVTSGHGRIPGPPGSVRLGPAVWVSPRGGRAVTVRGVEGGRQLDKAVLWMDTWDLNTRCVVLEAVTRCSDVPQWRLLMTVTQPWLHRDLMYWAHSLFPHLSFQPLSTHLSRKVKEIARRQERPGFYRMESRYPHPDHPSPSLPSLPSLSLSPSSATSVSSITTGRVTEAPCTHVRRHIQNESRPRAENKRRKRTKTLSQRKARTLPQEAQQLLTWYLQHWNEEERQTFLHHLLVTLDPREHYFLSTCLMMRQHMDFLTLLPQNLALHVLSFLSPRDLGVVSRVSKWWRRLANDNSLWETKCREVKMTVPVSDHPVWKRLFRDNLLLKHNWGQGRCRVTEFQGHKLSVLSVCVDGRRVASGSADSTVRVWDIVTGRRLHVLTGHSKGVWCLIFFTRHLLLSGSYDSTIRVWNLRSGTLCRTLLGHSGPVWCLALHGSCLVSGSNDKTAKIWDIGRCVLTTSLVGHKATVFTADFNTSGHVIYTGSADRTVRLWSRHTGQCVVRVKVSGKSAIMSLSVSQGYFACCHGSSVCLYRGTTLVATFKEHKQRVETVKLRVDAETGEGIIVSGGQDGLIKYWDIHRPDVSLHTFSGHTDAVNCIYFDDVRILTASQDHKVRLFHFIP